MLKITLDCERGIKKHLRYAAWIRHAAAAVLKEENINGKAEVNILLTDDEGIQIMNRDFRQKDAVTDVLSFPANELQGPLAHALKSGFKPEKDVRTGRMLLGDIAISIDKAKAQAKEYGHSEKREISFLTAHAMLHLTGYDHEADADEIAMREKQNNILNGLNIKR